MTPDLKRHFDSYANEVERALNRYLPRLAPRPSVIFDAMRYSVLAGGKRLRPILVMAGAHVCGGSWKKVLPTACALELIHTYSLIHDDLPSMDNDDLRRGRPTNHRVFGEDIAILAGDALLTQAFDLMARNRQIPGIKPHNVLRVIQLVAGYAGARGMIGGQVADVKSDGGRWRRYWKTQYRSEKHLLRFIHRNKTAALIKGSLLAGAILSGGTSIQLKALEVYGENLGLAFQVADDVLDCIGDKLKLGKRGSDNTNDKLTFPRLYGVKESQRAAKKMILKAHRALKNFGSKAEFLHLLADFAIERDH